MDWFQTRLSVIHFAWNAKVVWESPLNQAVDENCLYNRDGRFTYLGPPLRLAFDQLMKTVEHKNSSHLFLFTDGECKYPTKEMKSIRADLTKNVEKFKIDKRSRLNINLYCEGEKTCLKEINDEFGSMFEEHGLKQAFGGSICKIMMHINPN